MDVEQGNLILTLFEKINLAIFILNSDLRYENINTKGLELLHTSKEHVLGKKFTDLYPDAFQTQFGKHLQLVRKTEVPQEWEFYSLAAKQWLRVNAYKTNNTIILLFTNINKQHDLEELLVEKTTLLDLSFDAIQIQDEQNKILYWNKGAERVYGWKAEDVIGKISYEIFGTNFPGGYQKFFRQLKKTKYWKGILHHTTKTKKHIIVESTWTFLEKNGKMQILEINRDVTEKESAKEQLLLSERRFRSLIEHSADGIVVRDMHMRPHFASRAITRMLGYTPEAFLKINIMDIIHPDDKSLLVAQNKQLEKGKPITGIFRAKSKKGEWKWVEIYSQNLMDDPAVHGVVTNVRDITDEKVAEQKLEAREKRFKSLIENSSDIILVTNSQGKITYVSPSIEKIFGYKPEEMIDTPTKKYFHPEDVEKTMQNFKKLVTGRATSTSGEYRVKNKKGEWRWIYTEAKNLLNEPTINGIISNVRDITGEKLYQAEIENQNKKITEILENFNYGYYEINKDWKYVYVNKEAERLAQMKREDMVGKDVWKLFPGIENLESGQAMRRVMKSRQAEEYDVYFPPFKQWFHHYMFPTAEGISLYAMDITDRKNIEEEIDSTRKELDEILRHMPNSVMVQNEEGNIVYANDEAVKFGGYSSSDELLSAPRYDYIYRFDLRDEYGRKFPMEELPGRKAIKNGVSERATVKFIKKQTGEERWVTITASPIIGHKKKPLVVVVIEDITEFKEADVRKNDFISMASHELKTPLTSLKVYMHVLSDSQKVDEAKKREYIAKASDQVERLQDLVSEMLDQSTIQQGKLSLHLQEMYFDFFVKEFISNFEQTTDGFTILLKGKTESIVNIDKYRIEQVLANLLSNAIKYSRDKKEIVVTLSKIDNEVALSVQDFGMGIPPSERDNIFKPYYRVIGKKENTFPGMGMGLYISKDIMDKHGGKIFVESTMGKGTTFTITLPIAD